MKKTLTTTLVALGAITTSQAAITAGHTIGIDFDDSTVATTAPTTALNFNRFDANGGITDGNSQALNSLIRTADGLATTVNFSLTNLTGQDTNPVPSPGGITFGNFTDSTVFGDRIISNDASSGRITDGDSLIDGSGDRAHFVLLFTGLDDSLTYNLEGGHHIDNANSNFDTIWQVEQSGGVVESGVNFTHTFSGLQTDGSGNLEIYVIRQNNVDGRHVSISGLTLTAVPEPSSTALLGLGGLALLARRKRA